MYSGLFPLLREDAEHPLILIIQGWVGTSTVPALEQLFWSILPGHSPRHATIFTTSRIWIDG